MIRTPLADLTRRSDVQRVTKSVSTPAGKHRSGVALTANLIRWGHREMGHR
jgi:hypothetical protein